MRSYCIEQGNISSHLWSNMMVDNMRKIIYIFIYVLFALLCSTVKIDRKL